MSYTLYGSQTSPFVRRIRMLLSDIPFELKEINPYEGEDGITLNKINPLNKIPVLTHGELTIWDSRQIFNYLNSIHQFQTMNWQDENFLTAIDGMMDAGVALMLMKRSGINIDEQFMYIARQKDRVSSVLDYIKPYLETQNSKDWNFHSMSIYCFLDWALFRGLVDLSGRPECLRFLDYHRSQKSVTETQIPRIS